MKKNYDKPQLKIEKFDISDHTSRNITVSNTIADMDCLNDDYTFVYDNNY